MDAAPFIRLIGDFTNFARAIAPGLAALGFIASALQLLIAHVVGSPRDQELGKAGMIGGFEDGQTNSLNLHSDFAPGWSLPAYTVTLPQPYGTFSLRAAEVVSDQSIQGSQYPIAHHCGGHSLHVTHANPDSHGNWPGASQQVTIPYWPTR